MRIILPRLRPGQQAVHDIARRFRLLLAGRRWGKTRLGVVEAIERGLCGVPTGWVAPTYPLSRVGWLPIVSLSRQIPGTEILLSAREIRFPGGGSIAVRSADRPEGARGVGWGFVVVDEAAYMKPVMWEEVIRPALADREGGALLITTPNGYNWLHDLWLEAETDEAWATVRRSSREALPPNEYENLRRTMSSRAFSQEIEAEFVETGGNRYKAEWLRHVYTIDRDPEGRMLLTVGGETAFPLDEASRFGAVDLAASLRTEADYTVIASVAEHQGRMFVLDIFRARIEGPDIVPAIRRAVLWWDLSAVLVESTGFQLTVVQTAKREGLPVEQVPAEKDKVARSLSLETLAETGRLLFPDPDLVAGSEWVGECHRELLAFTGTQTGHDDQVDALSYAAIRVLRRAAFAGPLGV